MVPRIKFMKVSFNFDTGARRIRLRAEDPLEESVLKEMAYLGTKGVELKIRDLTRPGTIVKVESPVNDPTKAVRIEFGEFEIEMRINGFEKEKKAE
jgi:hypothetical protein